MPKDRKKLNKKQKNNNAKKNKNRKKAFSSPERRRPVTPETPF